MATCPVCNQNPLGSEAEPPSLTVREASKYLPAKLRASLLASQAAKPRARPARP